MTKRAKRHSTLRLVVRIVAVAGVATASALLIGLFAAFIVCIGMPAQLSTAQAQYVGLVTIVMAVIGGGFGLAFGVLVTGE